MAAFVGPFANECGVRMWLTNWDRPMQQFRGVGATARASRTPPGRAAPPSGGDLTRRSRRGRTRAKCGLRALHERQESLAFRLPHSPLGAEVSAMASSSTVTGRKVTPEPATVTTTGRESTSAPAEATAVPAESGSSSEASAAGPESGTATNGATDGEPAWASG